MTYNQTHLTDGAAYNPTTDTWRRLPDAPIASSGSQSVWTGDELIILGNEEPAQAAAYDPTANEWRRLAGAPEGALSEPIWTGTTILTTVETFDPDSGPNFASYDLSTDSWHLGDEAPYAALVAVPDDDGVSRTVIGLPFDTGAPVDVLDDTGNRVGHLPGQPGEVDVFGDRVAADGIWVGDEALFWIRGADSSLPQDGTTEAWALNPATQTWRPLPAGIESDNPVMTIGDILLVVPESAESDITRAHLYRPPTTPAG